MAEPSSINFRDGTSKIIDLSSGDVTTSLIPVKRALGFSIEAINATGLDGSPTWSIKSTNVNDVSEAVYYTDDSNNLSITDKIINRKSSGFNFFTIEIKMNGNTTGTIEFTYTEI